MNELPESDIEFLEQKGYEYQLIQSGTGWYLIISNFAIPETYLPRTANLLINIVSGYPNNPLDMFWTSPDVKLLNGNWPKNCDVHEVHNRINWQRWSRHYAWRPGVDNLRIFISAINRELLKGI